MMGRTVRGAAGRGAGPVWGGLFLLNTHYICVEIFLTETSRRRPEVGVGVEWVEREDLSAASVAFPLLPPEEEKTIPTASFVRRKYRWWEVEAEGVRSCEEFDRVLAASAWSVDVGVGVAAAEDTGGAAAPGKVASPGFVAAVDVVAGERLAAAGALAGLGPAGVVAPPTPPASRSASASGRVAASSSSSSGWPVDGRVVVVVEAGELPMAASPPGSLRSPGEAASPGRPAVVVAVVVGTPEL